MVGGAKSDNGTQWRYLRLSEVLLKTTFLSKSGQEPIPAKFPNDFGKI